MRLGLGGYTAVNKSFLSDEERKKKKREKKKFKITNLRVFCPCQTEMKGLGKRFHLEAPFNIYIYTQIQTHTDLSLIHI